MAFFQSRGDAAVCELRRKSTARRILLPILALALMTLVLARGPVMHAQEPTSAHEAASELAEESGHDETESLWPLVGKIFNFVALVGVLVYFLRGPLGEYLTSRRAQVRGDLESARALKADAERQIAELDARLKALPGEIAELEARGRAEVVAEQQRIRDLAAAERQRLLDQATRDIEAQVRAARRELMELAADLAVGAAERRIKGGITEQDRTRLVDQYVRQVGDHE